MFSAVRRFIFILALAVLASPAQAEAAAARVHALAKSGARAHPPRKPARPAKVQAKVKVKANIHTVRHVKRIARPHYRAAPVRADSPASLSSEAVLVIDPVTTEVLYEKNANAQLPIASLTKLMTATVVLDARQDMDELLTVTDADVDRLKHSTSRLRVGTGLTRSAMLHIALMSSENRAASALGRNYPGGTSAFVAAMNAKAKVLGMSKTRYVEPTGLSSENVSTPHDLAKLVIEAQRQPLIREYSTDREHAILQAGRSTPYRNTNRLISNASWDIALQKTGYISEAGRCMVLHAQVAGRAVVMVFLDAQGKFSRAADANNVRAWLASSHLRTRAAAR